MTYSLEDLEQRAYADINNYPSRYAVNNESEALVKLSNAYSVYKEKSDIYRPIYDEYTEYENIIKTTPAYQMAQLEKRTEAIIKRNNLQPYLDEALENMQNAEVYLFAWGLVLDKIRGLEDNALNSSATTNINRYYKEAQNVYYDKKAQNVNTKSVSASQTGASQTGASQTGNKKMLILAIAAGLLLLLYGKD